MPELRVNAPYQPTGDQPTAITSLVDGVRAGLRNQVLLARLREREIEPKLKVTDADIDAFIREQTGVRAGGMDLNMAMILVATPERANAAEQRARAVGAWASIGAVAAALGPPLGGLLVQASWHWVFLVNVPVGIVALVAGARVLR